MVSAPSRDAASVSQDAATGDPFGPLVARGISTNVIKQARISAASRYAYPYWRYPVHDATGHVIAWRYKRAGDDSSRRKYDWGTEQLPARTDAVYNIMAVEPGSSCVLGAGEPDCWLLASCGLRACSLLAGEGSVPGTAIDTLAARAPARVTVIYDNDETGRGGARKVTLALRARGIEAGARVLPDGVGPKGDVTDLLRLCAGDRARFLQAVRDLPALPECVPEATAPRRTGGSRSVGDGATPIERFKAQHDLGDVIEASGVELRSHQGGSYLQGRCPFHDDRSPSLVVWPERGYWKCYGCGARGDVIDFIERSMRARGPRP